MPKKKIISIIIPVYNAEKYLKRCINSIILQTYKDLEIILINDGSEDNSSKICDEYACIDNRIKVIHKENGGPSLAREAGVKIATGEYIAFVDADDYIDFDMFEILVNEAEKGLDIVQCGFRKVSPNGEVLETIELKPINISSTFECSLYYASQINTTNFLWNKLYKAELFKDIIFPKLYAGEDSCILTQIYASAKRIANIKGSFYNYVMTPNSLCRQAFSEKKLDNIEAGKFMYNFYFKRYPELCGFSALHICSYAARLYCEVIGVDINNKEERLDQLISDFNKFYNFTKNRFTRSMSSKKRIYFVELFKNSPRLCSLIYKLIYL